MLSSARWVSTSINRRVREIVEWSGGALSDPTPRKSRNASESAARQAIPPLQVDALEVVQDLPRRFDEYDFIISPVAAGPAFRHNHRHWPIELEGRTLAYLDYAMPFAIIYNACGNPALVVPRGEKRRRFTDRDPDCGAALRGKRIDSFWQIGRTARSGLHEA